MFTLWDQALLHQPFLPTGILLCALLAGQTVLAVNPELPPKTTPWIRFDLYPPEVVLAGAQWKLTNETVWRESGVYYTNVQEGTYRAEFKPVPGWILPNFGPSLEIRAGRFVRFPAHYEMETNQPAQITSANVVIYPLEAVEAGARWKLGVDTEWRDPRILYTNLPAADTYIEFKPVEGWNHPSNFPIILRSGSSPSITPSYTSSPSRNFPNIGYLAITPLEAVAEGAQWKLTTESEWHDPYRYSTNMPMGVHEIEFKPLTNWLPHPNIKIKIVQDHDQKANMSIMAYRPRPQYRITVNATHGQVNHSPTQWQNNDSGKFERQSDWKQTEWHFFIALNPNIPYWPPNGKPGDRVRLTAIADPGYQFAGWSGDIAGVRNPAALVLDSDKNITAHFIPVSTTELTASQAAESFFSPGTLMVHGQVNPPFGQTWDSLSWRPILPEGWTLSEVNGLGGPILQNGVIVFRKNALQIANPALGSVEITNSAELDFYTPLNPVQFTMVINVPPGQIGTNVIQGEITYAMKEGTNLMRGVAQANPIEWVRQEPPSTFLTLDVSAGPPILAVHGEPGISCTIQRRDSKLSHFPWTDQAHLRLTNSVQTWVDNTAESRPRGYIYRAAIWP